MTSPATTMRCTRCGATRRAIFGADLAHVPPGHASQDRPALCRGGVWVVDDGTTDIARDDRAGVTLPTAIQPVGRDQLEPGRVGRVEGDGDAGCGHSDNIATISVGGDVNRTLEGGPTGSRDFTERNHA